VQLASRVILFRGEGWGEGQTLARVETADPLT